MLIPNLYEDPAVLHQNTMPVHCYFIPDSPASDASLPPLRRENSERLQMLSGCKWSFRFYRSIHDLHENFYDKDFRPNDEWTKEIVPFCWQMHGFDQNQYTNIRYPFPFDPPYVPQENPCGTYIRRFTWEPDEDAPLTHLCFEGVDSCFYVWLNGQYVGYSQVTHHTSEFDVSSILNKGENVLAVLVLKWCDGSYLEDQDKFRLSGIIRDVYLLRRPGKHITDYVITTDLSDDLSCGELNIRFSFNDGPIPVRLRLLCTDGSCYELATGSTAEDGCSASIVIKDPLLWNAEEPNLYTLLIETEHEIIREHVGFRTVCVKDGVLLLNGSPIKFRGVNRHESDPVMGSVVCYDQVLTDLRTIKAHNFNAVRASHYPNVPYFYQMCDEFGLYVIDEADNESHGTGPLYFNEDDYSERMRLAHERIADNPDFLPATLDRVSSMVLRNRNRPCILIWSMGNECGYGCTFEDALQWTKKTDPTRLTHYESAFYLPRDRTYDVSNIDIFGRMYPAFDEIDEYFVEKPQKPLLLVEYCHSMGNSPGDFMEYRNLIEKYEGLCGGFVWEWCDHAVYKGLSESGKTMYFYGGDHGELQHDGNFCLDGLVYPDRRPHTGLYEYKNVHRPLRSTYNCEKSMLVIHNYMDFLDPAPLVAAEYCLTADGKEIKRGTIEIPSIAPHSEACVPLMLSVPNKGRCFLLITYTVKSAIAGLPAEHVLGFDELPIKNAEEIFQKSADLFPAVTDSDSAPGIEQEGDELCITGEGFAYRMDLLSGLFTSMQHRRQEFLQKPIDFNVWRAPTDNDRPAADLWKWERLDHTVTRCYTASREIADGEAIIRLRQSVGAMSVPPVLRIDTEYRISPDGTVRMYFHAKKDPQFLTLPRIGLRLFLDPRLDTAEYFGIGPYESYVDKCRSGRHGIFRSAVKDLHEDYIRPQENGSHCDCSYVRLTGSGLSFTAAAEYDDTFSFNASIYTQEELEAKQHNYELKPCGATVLCLDHKMAGIGSGSCGPDLSPKYRVDADEYRFGFVVRPCCSI